MLGFLLKKKVDHFRKAEGPHCSPPHPHPHPPGAPSRLSEETSHFRSGAKLITEGMLLVLLLFITLASWCGWKNEVEGDTVLGPKDHKFNPANVYRVPRVAT